MRESGRIYLVRWHIVYHGNVPVRLVQLLFERSGMPEREEFLTGVEREVFEFLP